MSCTIHFYLLNDDFSVEHAEAVHGGEESENNRKYEWEDELKVTTEVSGIAEHENASFPLQGELPDGKVFEHEVMNMRMFEIQGDTPVWVGCSESLLDSSEIIVGDDITLRVYLKDYEPMANPIPGIYIASQEFPKELIVD